MYDLLFVSVDYFDVVDCAIKNHAVAFNVIIFIYKFSTTLNQLDGKNKSKLFLLSIFMLKTVVRIENFKPCIQEEQKERKGAIKFLFSFRKFIYWRNFSFAPSEFIGLRAEIIGF